jgi:enoyl-CoA hydratase
MGGQVHYVAPDASGVALLTIANPAKHNAIDIAMWRALRTRFDAIDHLAAEVAPRCVVVCGAAGQFASGGDIDEFAGFRFDENALRHFHEHIVAPALQAMLDCDVPLVAQIDGACIGGGLEVAACCDIRVCGKSSRFGVPIARLGFPMAPGELQRMVQAIDPSLMRSLLLEARLLDSAEALRERIVHAVAPDDDVATQAWQRAERIATLAPNAARINKQTLRQLARGGPTETERHAHFGYADSAEHREGIAAFLEKRAPRFRKE